MPTRTNLVAENGTQTYVVAENGTGFIKGKQQLATRDEGGKSKPIPQPKEGFFHRAMSNYLFAELLVVPFEEYFLTDTNPNSISEEYYTVRLSQDEIDRREAS